MSRHKVIVTIYFDDEEYLNPHQNSAEDLVRAMLAGDTDFPEKVYVTEADNQD